MAFSETPPTVRCSVDTEPARIFDAVTALAASSLAVTADAAISAAVMVLAAIFAPVMVLAAISVAVMTPAAILPATIAPAMIFADVTALSAIVVVVTELASSSSGLGAYAVATSPTSTCTPSTVKSQAWLDEPSVWSPNATMPWTPFVAGPDHETRVGPEFSGMTTGTAAEPTDTYITMEPPDADTACTYAEMVQVAPFGRLAGFSW